MGTNIFTMACLRFLFDLFSIATLRQQIKHILIIVTVLPPFQKYSNLEWDETHLYFGMEYQIWIFQTVAELENLHT